MGLSVVLPVCHAKLSGLLEIKTSMFLDGPSVARCMLKVERSKFKSSLSRALVPKSFFGRNSVVYGLSYFKYRVQTTVGLAIPVPGAGVGIACFDRTADYLVVKLFVHFTLSTCLVTCTGLSVSLPRADRGDRARQRMLQ